MNKAWRMSKYMKIQSVEVLPCQLFSCVFKRQICVMQGVYHFDVDSICEWVDSFFKKLDWPFVNFHKSSMIEFCTSLNSPSIILFDCFVFIQKYMKKYSMAHEFKQKWQTRLNYDLILVFSSIYWSWRFFIFCLIFYE